MKRFIPVIVIVLLVVVGLTLTTLNNKDDTATQPVKNNGSYIALGDSVAAGIGLADYSDASACNRTEQSYPHAVAQHLSYTLTSLACSGATTKAGLIGPQEVNRLLVEPQLDATLRASKPKLITMTIGANDAEWTSFIQKCYTAVCGSESDTAQVSAGISSATTNVQNTLARIKEKYPTNSPRIIVTGYYKLFAAQPQPSCTEQTGLDSAELIWIRQLQDNIDAALQATVANYSFAQFVPVSFNSHELCTAEPWVQGLGGKAPFHPTADGQAAIANQIVQAVGTKR